MKKQYLINALIAAHSVKDNSHFVNRNSLRSAKFLYEFAKEIKELLPEFDMRVQEVDNRGRKSSGEWLFDACFTTTKPITEVYTNSSHSNDLVTTVDWIIESEYSTGLSDFSVDFGKLLVANSKTVVYLNGMNQTTEDGRARYIERRLQAITTFLKTAGPFPFETMYLGFWPSPEKPKTDSESLWDTSLDSLVCQVRLFTYSLKRNTFIEIEQ